MMTRKRALWLLFAIAIALAGFYLWGSSSTPAGQPPLVSLNEANLSQFQENFNAAVANTRIVLLLSPT